MLFLSRFWINFSSISRGFGRLFGPSWWPLGHFGMIFWLKFQMIFLLLFICRLLGATWAWFCFDFGGFWDHFFEILDLLAEEMLELISNLKLKLFLLQFKMSSCNFEWFLLPIGELVEPILNFNKSSTMFRGFLAEEMRELISNWKLKLFLLKFKISSCNSEWFLLPTAVLVN